MHLYDNYLEAVTISEFQEPFHTPRNRDNPFSEWTAVKEYYYNLLVEDTANVVETVSSFGYIPKEWYWHSPMKYSFKIEPHRIQSSVLTAGFDYKHSVAC